MSKDRHAELFTRTGKPRHNTVEVWRGPSRIEGSPLVVLVTGLKGSHKAKTFDGKTWGARSCYVRVDTAPLGIWRAWDRGNVPRVTLAELSELTRARMVRLGTYGDPASVPLTVWDSFCSDVAGWTGYTHQARNRSLRDVLKYCQISADSREDALAAYAANVGSFRVLASGEDPLPFEMRCPASEEAGRSLTCSECLACSGINGKSVVIDAHGIGAKHYQISTRRALSLLEYMSG